MGKWTFGGFANSWKRKNGLVSIEIGPNGFALAKIEESHHKLHKLSVCEYYEEDQFLKQKDALRDAVAKHKLMGHSCNLVLHPSEYQLLLVEAPNVAPQELRQAMRWQVKDLVHESLDDMIIDVFPLPGDSFRGRTAMVYVVVVARDIIKKHVSSAKECGLNLLTIDISELCLRNITALLQQNSDDSVGLLMLGEGGGSINLTEGPRLYLSRKIEIDVREIASVTNSGDPVVETLALEVQRSFDYYESQLGKGIITHMMVAPSSVDIAGVVNLLDEMLQVKVDRIDLGSQLEMGDTSPAMQAKCFAAIGAALRQKAA